MHDLVQSLIDHLCLLRMLQRPSAQVIGQLSARLDYMRLILIQF